MAQGYGVTQNVYLYCVHVHTYRPDKEEGKIFSFRFSERDSERCAWGHGPFLRRRKSQLALCNLLQVCGHSLKN